MKEQIENIKLIVKNDRRVWAIAGFLLFCALLVLMSSKPQRPSKQITFNNPSANMNEGENSAFQDLLAVVSADLKEMTVETKEISEEVKRLKNDAATGKARMSGIFEGILDKMEALTDEVDDLRSMRKDQVEVSANQNESVMVAPPPENIESWGLDGTSLPPEPPKAPEAPLKISLISAGDNVSLQLLTGVAAPVDGTPYPVMFKVMGPITGPDGSNLNVGEARIIAAAEGRETDSRVIFRLSELAIRHSDGRRSVVDIDGWIIGEDGLRGMPGSLKDNLGSTMVALSTIASAQALGDIVADKAKGKNNNNKQDFVLFGGGNEGNGSSIQRTDFDSAIALGVTDTFEKMTDIIVDRFEKQVPVVEILPGRSIQAVFSSNSEIELIDEEDEESIYYDSSLS